MRASRLRASARILCVLACLALRLLVCPSPVEALVISEIHYNPPGGEDSLEFLEIANDTTTPQDLSGYRLSEGVRFEFPRGTILRGGGFIVVCADVDALVTRYGIDNAIGNFEGRLDGSGERITIVNQVDIEVMSLRYRDSGKWPTAPDGTGHTLSLLDVHLDPAEPESWTWSTELGGTPGLVNFAVEEERFVEDVLIDVGEIWKFSRGTGPFSSPSEAWIEPDFDDGAWEEGPSGFGYGDDDDNTVLDDMEDSYIAVAIRKRFLLSSEQLDGPGEFDLGMSYDDGFCAYINGTAFAQMNCSTDLAFDDGATGSHEAREEAIVVIPRALLRDGENVLAIVGRNFTIGSADFSLAPRLLHRRSLNSGAGATGVLFNELYRGRSQDGWIELYNASETPADLSGFALAGDPERQGAHVFPADTVIPPAGFLTVDEANTSLRLSEPEVGLFLFDGDGIVITATVFEREPPPGLFLGDYAEAR